MPAAESPRVLVIDDESSVLRAISHLLTQDGYQVTCIDLPNKTLEVVKLLGPFDLVITDILMPDCDGFELIGELRNELPGMRIMAISGGKFFGNRTFADCAHEAGADVALPKPFNYKELMAGLRKALNEDG